MFENYLSKVLQKAEYKLLDDGNWFASVPGFEGVWANGKTVEETRNELIEVLEDWLILKLKDNEKVPFFEIGDLAFSENEAELV